MTVSWEVVSLGVSLFVTFTGSLVGAIAYLFKRQVQGIEARLEQMPSFEGIEKRLDDLAKFLQNHLQEDLRRRDEDERRWRAVEQGLWELRAELPREYVRREDWIRFGGALEFKMDAIHKRIDELKGEVTRARS